MLRDDPELKLSWTVSGGLLCARCCDLQCSGTKLILADGSQIKVINTAASERLSVSRLEVLDGECSSDLLQAVSPKKGYKSCGGYCDAVSLD